MPTEQTQPTDSSTIMKYNAVAHEVSLFTKAKGAFVVVMEGERGSGVGFDLKAKDALPMLPTIMRQQADALEAALKQLQGAPAGGDSTTPDPTAPPPSTPPSPSENS